MTYSLYRPVHRINLMPVFRTLSTRQLYVVHPRCVGVTLGA